MIVKGKWGSAAGAVALTAVTVLAAGCSSSSASSGGDSIANSLPTNYGPAETTTLNVGVVPAMDSAGFFVAQNENLFAKEGLTIKYIPETSSETAIATQLKGGLQISAGNYVSYIQAVAQQHDPLEVISEGSVMQQGAQTIFVMPKSHITKLSQLKGKLVGVNAPGNIDYLLDVSVLKENGISPTSVDFPTVKDKASAKYGGAIPFPFMAGDLADGEIAAATLPEPFASIAEQSIGAVPLTDLNQGATTDFGIEGYVVTKAWAAANPNTLSRFLAALSAGQEIADTNRAEVEKSFEDLPANNPISGHVSTTIAAVMALDSYPIGIDETRLQRVANVMFQFGLLKSQYNVSSMVLPSADFNFSPFAVSGS